MYRERIESNWKKIKARTVDRWGKLPDDDLDVAEGRRRQPTGKIQQRYGLAKEWAANQVSARQRNAVDDSFC